MHYHVTDMPRRKYAMRLNLSLFLEENQIFFFLKNIF